MLMRLLPLLLLMLGSLSTLSIGFELQPLATRNLSPVTLGFGLPSLGSARVLQPRSGQGQVTLDLLSDQRRNLVGFVSLGCGWQPWTRLGLQLQFDGHSPFYRQSTLEEISDFSGQLAIGGSLALGEQTVLELAVVEDIIVATAPDVVFHLALRTQF